LQAQRYERGVAQLENALDKRRERLQRKWQHAALRVRLHELEYSLKMQHKRLQLLMLQAGSANA